MIVERIGKEKKYFPIFFNQWMIVEKATIGCDYLVHITLGYPCENIQRISGYESDVRYFSKGEGKGREDETNRMGG